MSNSGLTRAALAGAAAGVFCSVLAAVAAPELPQTVVKQKDRLFAPTEVSIPAGSSLRFDNDDPFLHQIFVSSPSFSFDSDEQAPGRSLDVPFPTRGEFRVLCGIHPKMTLTVRVR